MLLAFLVSEISVGVEPWMDSSVTVTSILNLTISHTGKCSDNFEMFVSKKKKKLKICFCFNPRCGIWGCLRLSTAADYDLPRALAGV